MVQVGWQFAGTSSCRAEEPAGSSGSHAASGDQFNKSSQSAVALLLRLNSRRRRFVHLLWSLALFSNSTL
eukprot:8794306-Pyramimonas_sp.AAC.1